MSSHTPEPWHTGGDGTIIYAEDGWATANATVFHMRQRPHEAHANAARIVACINACAGVPTADLVAATGGGILGTANRFYAGKVKQAEILLIAIKHVANIDPDDPEALQNCIAAAGMALAATGC